MLQSLKSYIGKVFYGGTAEQWVPAAADPKQGKTYEKDKGLGIYPLYLTMGWVFFPCIWPAYEFDFMQIFWRRLVDSKTELEC